MRKFSLVDLIVSEIDTALQTLLIVRCRKSRRENPAKDIPASNMNREEMRHVAGLMRVNHAGEVCAQALYQGQALTAKLTDIREQMARAAEEEVDHLAWCEERLAELNSRPSILNPVWYVGSLMIGALAGLAGDRWSLGFVAETEKQVTKHLASHLGHLPAHDHKTRAILAQMQADEIQHAEAALRSGGRELPLPVKKVMSGVSKLMTKSSYYI
ncbi:2-polyprenyl-3-methyl-6-methoxy-1,4-benzoquinone monooxygenase [Legionella londiniensis]|uniref:3-demethoxyubiquinol 3-hydroxylase n=1 Tax=Legionella londiniensis TaxID=45068 RepID=A0A0W0VHG2_9GAMM|nr:2-polyprenyl-3-methyl-6-methoxy-1,4-benzoquinone monooxygenase [Legionella londiniensis]KTD19573.1 ubiquinone biosynthesis protein [Legionella londiniensis]STX92204.1 ubiquinone biosynthesis protein [Legionella londiniensis]